MRISDWSSDVCSSDLIEDESVAGLDAHVFSQVDVPAIPMLAADPRPVVTDLDRASPAIKRSLIAFGLVRIAAVPIHSRGELLGFVNAGFAEHDHSEETDAEIGRASCRERVGKCV